MIAWRLGDIDGGGADDVLLTTGALDSGQSSVFTVLGEAIDKQSSDVVTLDRNALAGKAIRVLAPPLDGVTSGTDGFGAAFARTGEVDGDGIAELVIGASLSGSRAGFTERPGAVYVIPSTQLTSAIETGVSIDLGDYF